jgi:hypothetical protein
MPQSREAEEAQDGKTLGQIDDWACAGTVRPLLYGINQTDTDKRLCPLEEI